jgi:hypothetical protein
VPVHVSANGSDRPNLRKFRAAAPLGTTMRSDARQRRFLTILTALAALCLIAQGISGVPELTLYLTPLFLIATLLLSGHYVAEDAIVRGWRGVRAVARRMRARRVAVPEARCLSSLLERSPLRRRGPPVSPSLAS